MSAVEPMSPAPATTPLPERPDLRHLRDEARALVHSGEALTHAKALFAVARHYGFASWTRLKAEVESRQEVGALKAAIDAEDWARVRDLMTLNPALHRAPLGYGKNGPLTWLAECRVPWKSPTPERLEMAAWMIAHGSDVHQGGDGPLMRAALMDYRIPMMELLVAQGADVNALWNGNYPIILAPCETLAPQSLRFLLAHGANSEPDARFVQPIPMLLGTYSRDARRKQECLEVFAEQGFPFPDTPPIALHRGRLDLLEIHRQRDPAMPRRRFSVASIFPPQLGMEPGAIFTWTPVLGVNLLHLAAEFDDVPTATWLIEHGANVNYRAAIDGERFGGHTPLFHAMVFGRGTDEMARLLLRHGADPNHRASLRHWFSETGKPEIDRVHGYRDVTPLGYARTYAEQQRVNQAAVAAVEEAGGAF